MQDRTLGCGLQKFQIHFYNTHLHNENNKYIKYYSTCYT